MVIVWLSIGAALVVVELSHLAFFALFAALGCFAAAGVAALWPSAVGIQILAVAWSRSRASSASSVPREAIPIPGVRTAHGACTGHRRRRGAHPRRGRRRLARWPCPARRRAMAGVQWRRHDHPAGTTVVVTAVRGTTLTVWPVGGFGPGEPPELGSARQHPESGQQPKEEQS